MRPLPGARAIRLPCPPINGRHSEGKQEMRILLKVSMPHETANALARAGKLGETIGTLLEDLKPEAAYFAAMDGKRTGIIVLNIDDPSEIPAIAEPFFLALGADVEIHPAMTPDDLMKAGPAIAAAAEKYG